MTTDSRPLAERVAGAIQQLSLVATDLNKASDELGQAIAAIDAVLQSLGIGVSTWTSIESGDELPDDAYYWSRDIGYDKVGKKWGISLRDISGSYDWPDHESRDTWLFNDGPRWLRVKGVSKIPDLLDALIRTTEQTTNEIRSKTAEANNLAVTIAQAAGKKPPLSLTAKAVLGIAAKDVATGPTPTEMTAEASKNGVQETREQQRRREKVFNALAAVEAAKRQLGKGKK